MTMFQFLRREFLYVFGAFGALLILWWKGHAFVLGQHISGYRWQDYFFNAWIIRLQESQLYDPFRNPLHGYLLSSLGDAVNSYIHAAILISSLSVTLSVLVLGWGVRQCSGRGAGAITMLTLAYSSLVYEATNWGNLYPMLGGLMGIVVGISLICFQSSSTNKWIFLFFPFSILLWAADPRGIPIAIVALLGLFLYSIEKGRMSQQKLILLCTLSSLSIYLGMQLEDGLGMAQGKHLQANSYLEEQKLVIYRWLTITNNPIMSQMCSSIDTSLILTPSLLSTDCGMEMIKENLVIQIPKGHVLPITFLWFGLILAIVPPHYRNRGTTSWFIRVLFLGYLAVHVITMPIVQRYMHIFIMPLLSISILGALRFVPQKLWVRIMCVCSFIAYIALYSSPIPSPSYIANEKYNNISLEIKEILPQNANYLDCSGYGINLHMLPENTIPYTPPPPLFKHILADSMDMFCTSWIRKPYPNAYIGLVKNIGGTPKDQQIRNDLFTLVGRKRGWELVHMRDGYYLYQYQK